MPRAQVLDRIRIIDLMLRCRIGVTAEERRERQDVIINLVLHADLRRACRSDRMADTVDYKAIKKQVIAVVENASYALVEHLAEKIAAVCLREKRVKKVEVSVEKPGALRFARSVGVEIVRAQS